MEVLQNCLRTQGSWHANQLAQQLTKTPIEKTQATLNTEFSFLSESVTNLFKDTGKLACKSASTPIDPNHMREHEEAECIDKEM